MHCKKKKPSCGPHLNPGADDLNKPELTLPEAVSTQVSAFLTTWF